MEASPIFGDAGVVLQVVETAWEITDLDRRAADLTRRQSELEALVDNLPDLTWLKGSDGRYLLVNRAFADEFGLSRNEIRGRTDKDVWPPEMADYFRKQDLEVLSAGQVVCEETSFTDASGIEGWIETLESPIFNAAGDVVNTSDDKNYISGYITITIPFDTDVVVPGTFEAGTSVIRHAETLDDLLNGVFSSDPVTNIQPDYLNGTVTFRTLSLSVFGVEAGAGEGEDEDETTAGHHGDDDDWYDCFIATAAYGSPFEGHVEILRQFRDAYLLPTRAGQAFVNAYYNLSPPVAEFIAEHNSLRAMVRWSLAPVVGMSYVALYTTAAEKILIILLMFSLLTGGCLAIRRLKTRKTIC